jgi:branched-chain amino acid transport system ATP-binding protein
MLTLDHIAKRFGGIQAVSDVTFAVARGEIVALIGPNGAGKTTLFSLIAGFLAPDAGTIRFEDRDVTGLPPHRIAILGLVRTFQITQPFERLTVAQNIAVGAHLHLASPGAAQRRAVEIAERVGLGKWLDRAPRELTVAGRKRLELARALATEPHLLLLDEVMAGLNPTEIDAIVPTIFAIRDSGITILLTEHVMRAVMRLSDRVLVLNNGRLLAQGKPAEVAADPAVIEAYLGRGAAPQTARRLAHG